MRALTVQQPYAWAIAYGGKGVENRTRPLSYRGPLAIHAGLSVAQPGFFPTQTPEGREAALALDALGGRGNCWNPRHYIQTPLHSVPHPGLALGAVVALAEVTGCHHALDCEAYGPEGRDFPWRGCSSWAMPGQYHIELATPRPLREAVSCRGALGLWRLPEDVERAVTEQLAPGPAARKMQGG